jgi:hypothetical protein
MMVARIQEIPGTLVNKPYSGRSSMLSRNSQRFNHALPVPVPVAADRFIEYASNPTATPENIQ